MSTEFASAGLTAGQLNAIVKKLGGHEMALRFLRDELSVSEPTRSWHEEDGVIYFSVTSDGMTGEEWITRLESKGFHVGDCVKRVLRSQDFKPTSGVTTEVAVLKSTLFKDNDRTTKNIRAEADKRKLKKPNAEVACLVREKFVDNEIEAMDLWRIVAIHKPINDSDGDPLLLGVCRSDNNDLRIYAYLKPTDCWWNGDGGFAFAVSQVHRDAPRK